MEQRYVDCEKKIKRVAFAGSKSTEVMIRAEEKASYIAFEPDGCPPGSSYVTGTSEITTPLSRTERSVETTAEKANSDFSENLESGVQPA